MWAESCEVAPLDYGWKQGEDVKERLRGARWGGVQARVEGERQEVGPARDQSWRLHWGFLKDWLELRLTQGLELPFWREDRL